MARKSLTREYGKIVLTDDKKLPRTRYHAENSQVFEDVVETTDLEEAVEKSAGQIEMLRRKCLRSLAGECRLGENRLGGVVFQELHAAGVLHDVVFWLLEEPFWFLEVLREFVLSSLRMQIIAAVALEWKVEVDLRDQVDEIDSRIE